MEFETKNVISIYINIELEENLANLECGNGFSDSKSEA